MAKKSSNAKSKSKPAKSKAKPAPKRAAAPARKAPVTAAKPVASPKPAKPAKPVIEEPTTIISKTQSTTTLGRISEDDLKKVKTGLNKRDLDGFRQLLLEKRKELLGDVASLQTDAKNDGGNLSNMPLHMADVGSDNYEQEFTLGLVEADRRLLREIDEALVRMKLGYYGVCLERGVPISKARLEVTPWARYCIEVAREMERRGR